MVIFVHSHHASRNDVCLTFPIFLFNLIHHLLVQRAIVPHTQSPSPIQIIYIRMLRNRIISILYYNEAIVICGHAFRGAFCCFMGLFIIFNTHAVCAGWSVGRYVGWWVGKLTCDLSEESFSTITIRKCENTHTARSMLGY